MGSIWLHLPGECYHCLVLTLTPSLSVWLGQGRALWRSREPGWCYIALMPQAHPKILGKGRRYWNHEHPCQGPRSLGPAFSARPSPLWTHQPLTTPGSYRVLVRAEEGGWQAQPGVAWLLSSVLVGRPDAAGQSQMRFQVGQVSSHWGSHLCVCVWGSFLFALEWFRGLGGACTDGLVNYLAQSARCGRDGITAVFVSTQSFPWAAVTVRSRGEDLEALTRR